MIIWKPVICRKLNYLENNKINKNVKKIKISLKNKNNETIQHLHIFKLKNTPNFMLFILYIIILLYIIFDHVLQRCK